MQPCMNDICMRAMYAWMNVCVWDSYDSITVRLLRQVWAGPKGSGLTSHYKYSVIFIGDNITGDESKHCRGKALQTTDGVKPTFLTIDGVKPIFKPNWWGKAHIQTNWWGQDP
jgi:hypothetical protein